MNEIFDPNYWRGRLEQARASRQLWKSVWNAHKDLWDETMAAWKVKLAQEVKPEDAILDAGCGYGNLLSLLPVEWRGKYLGIDMCPDMVKEAQRLHPTFDFLVADLRMPLPLLDRFDVAVVASVKGMIIRKVGQDVWDGIESNLKRVADRLVVLEYGDRKELA